MCACISCLALLFCALTDFVLEFKRHNSRHTLSMFSNVHRDLSRWPCFDLSHILLQHPPLFFIPNIIHANPQIINGEPHRHSLSRPSRNLHIIDPLPPPRSPLPPKAKIYRFLEPSIPDINNRQTMHPHNSPIIHLSSKDINHSTSRREAKGFDIQRLKIEVG